MEHHRVQKEIVHARVSLVETHQSPTFSGSEECMTNMSGNEDVEARLRRLEDLIGPPPSPDARDLFDQLSGVRTKLDTLVRAVAQFTEDVPNSLEVRFEAINDKIRRVKDDVKLLKIASREWQSRSDEDRVPSTRVRVPEPNAFGGARDAKELENFLWDMENYFQAAGVPDAEKVAIACMYLNGDAKLWWRARLSGDASANRESIKTWESMKTELKGQFLPQNASWVAREALRQLKHTGPVREYVKSFSSLMLDIRDMSEEDKVFNFVAGLQPWAQTELRRQAVNDLSGAMAAADRLNDYSVVKSVSSEGHDSEKGKYKKGGGFQRDVERLEGSGKSEGQSTVKPTSAGCFLCNGDHRMRNCPKRTKLSALMLELEREDSDCDDVPLVNPIQLLGALMADRQPSVHKGLMYVRVLVNGQDALAMIDSGATHNFVSEREIARLGLGLSKLARYVKAVNSDAKSVMGVANVELKVGPWSGRCEFTAFALEGFDLILGQEFLVQASVAVIPHLGGLLIMDQKGPGFVKGTFRGMSKSELDAGRFVSALQGVDAVGKSQGSSQVLTECFDGTELGAEQAAQVRVKPRMLQGRRADACRKGCSTFLRNAGMSKALTDQPKTRMVAGVRRDVRFDDATLVRVEPPTLDRVREVC
ncbi:hypothetical protein CASFOL_029249 [Castilleja foliolosa]|uniref:Retrotransposon gag domain-containing protein n=1 Tax=Castilleja foliolosa TaxID=1961234 RepID=A0ABD3CAR4_9LAMI